MIVRATVQRSCAHPESGLPYMEHRTYDLVSNKWDWSISAADAHIFPDIDDAEKQVTQLKLQGEKKVFPFIHTEFAEKKRQVLIEHRHKSPQEVFAELEKRGLA